jgi:nicotinamide-nucleotide amidase
MRAAVIAIGDELTSGQRLDTNSRWLSAELAVLGIPVVLHATANDTLAIGEAVFRAAVERADVVVATGGLGPTADDLTRDVLAAIADQPLERSPAALAVVESRFSVRGMPMPVSNRRQADFPRGSRIIPNPTGTAPGIDIDVPLDGHVARVFALPGVPAEMHVMWRDTVLPALLAMQPEQGTIHFRRIKCFGAGESAIEGMLPDLTRRGREPLVGITAHEATITLRIAARGPDEAACRAAIGPTEQVIRNCLGPLVFGVEDEEVEDAALEAVVAAGLTLAVVEAGTLGRVTALFAEAQARAARGADAPAVPTGFRGGTVVAAEPCGGAAAVAESLADQARRAFGTALGLGVGAARPGPEGRRVIEVALAGSSGVRRIEHVLGGGPTLMPVRAAKTAVDFVRRTLLAEGVEG